MFRMIRTVRVGYFLGAFFRASRGTKKSAKKGGTERGKKAEKDDLFQFSGRRSRTTKRQAEEEDEKLTKARKEKIHVQLRPICKS